MNFPIYRAFINDENDGIEFISIVEHPAIEKNFLAFKENLKFSIVEDKHLITGPVMIANMPIYRRDEERGEYYVVFEPDVIRNMATKLLSDKAMVNIEHSDPVDGVMLQEAYIKDSSRGIDPKEFEDVPDGSLFCTFKVDNPELWREIKEGTFKGFSLQGIFELEDEVDLYNAILKDLKKLRNVK